MLSSHSDEFRLIEAARLREPASAAVACGIGDDAAVLADGTLLATDTLLEGRHYTPEADPRAVGHKAVAVNLSDIAAMGGTPVAATVALTLRRSAGAARADALMAGLQETAARHGVALVGGDTTSWEGPEAVSVTVLGRSPAGGAVLRSGARPGHGVFVTGPLGGSLRGRHLTFEPRLREGAEVAALGATAMIDLSDGLSSDAAHLAAASGIRIVLDADAIPVHADAGGLDAALRDGEDFELLFTLPPGVPCGHHRIGVVRAGRGVHLRRGGVEEPLVAAGFSHDIGGDAQTASGRSSS